MLQRIEAFGVVQTAKVMAAMYGLLGLVLIPIFFLASSMAPAPNPFPAWLAIVLPLMYAGLGFVFVALGCALYNWVAKWTGGIEVDIGG